MNYQELLHKLKDCNDKHLLLGNGFNNSLGIKTNYSEIFSRMKNNYSGYEKIKDYLDDKYFDIEELIGVLKRQIKIKSDDENLSEIHKIFLKDYIEQKIKLDFMKATNEIVQDNINQVYRETNQDVYLFLRDFNKYFTLNYDPFLYLLLLKFKTDENALALKKTSLFQKNNLDKNQNNIYTEIKKLRENGVLDIGTDDNKSSTELSKATKTTFETAVKEYNKYNKRWKGTDIEKACKLIWKEESNKPVLDVNDGFQGGLFQDVEGQNLYFLHGAFHIVKNNRVVRKITSKQNKSFVQKLEEAIHNKDKDIVCVLTNQSEEKKKQIEENEYLTKCLKSLSEISGSLVILGSSLDKKDQHIFDQINMSNISDLYISSCKKYKSKDYEKANKIFDQKNITLFDYMTISYKEQETS